MCALVHSLQSRAVALSAVANLMASHDAQHAAITSRAFQLTVLQALIVRLLHPKMAGRNVPKCKRTPVTLVTEVSPTAGVRLNAHSNSALHF